MIEVTEIESLAEFIEAVEIAPLFGNKVLFRGQSVKRNLLPSVAREDHTADTTELEQEALEQMRCGLRAQTALTSTHMFTC